MGGVVVVSKGMGSKGVVSNKHGDGKYFSCKRVNGRQHGMQGVGTLVY